MISKSRALLEGLRTLPKDQVKALVHRAQVKDQAIKLAANKLEEVKVAKSEFEKELN